MNDGICHTQGKRYSNSTAEGSGYHTLADDVSSRELPGLEICNLLGQLPVVEVLEEEVGP